MMRRLNFPSDVLEVERKYVVLDLVVRNPDSTGLVATRAIVLFDVLQRAESEHGRDAGQDSSTVVVLDTPGVSQSEFDVLNSPQEALPFRRSIVKRKRTIRGTHATRVGLAREFLDTHLDDAFVKHSVAVHREDKRWRGASVERVEHLDAVIERTRLLVRVVGHLEEYQTVKTVLLLQ